MKRVAFLVRRIVTLAFCYFCDQFYEIVLCWFRHA